MRHPWLLAAALPFLLIAMRAPAQIYDARSMGMGGVHMPRSSGVSARVNPAYRAVPITDLDRGRSIPLPIGLLGLIGDLPSFDVEDDDFDLIALADFVWNFPWALQLGAPTSAQSDILLDVSRDAVTIDLGEARDRVPSEGFSAGDYRTLFDLGFDLELGERYGTVYLGVLQGWEVDEIEVALDDALVGVLRDAEPIVGGRSYALEALGRAQVGLSSSVVYAREIPLRTSTPTVTEEDWLDAYWTAEATRPRLWAGLGVRRYVGLATIALDGDIDLTGQDPLLADASTFDLDSDTEVVRATPRGFTGLGTGWALDLGAVLRWSRFEFGAGIADLLADLHWDRARIDRIVYDDLQDDFVQESLPGDRRITTTLPRSWRLNTLWRADPRMVVATDLSGGPGGTSWHLGGERWVRDHVAVRAGLERDRREQWQAGAGVGLRWSAIGIDVGLRSHSRNVAGDRMVEMGLALVFGGARP